MSFNLKQFQQHYRLSDRLDRQLLIDTICSVRAAQGDNRPCLSISSDSNISASTTVVD